MVIPVSTSSFAIFIIYLLYGAVFFAIGIAVTSRRKLFEHLNISGLFWLLAAFALTHAAHEWLEMFRHLDLSSNRELAARIRHISLLFSLTSFILLFLFGTTLIISLSRNRRYQLFFIPATALAIFCGLLIIRHPWNSLDLMQIVEYDMRLLLAFPSSLITAVGFFYYWYSLKKTGVRGAWYFFGTGCGFAFYAVFTGLIPSATSLYLPVEIWRALSALVILTFLMSALDTFMAQREEDISKRLMTAANSEKLSAIGRLAAGIAHEINNPLANASLQLELLRRQADADIWPPKYSERLDIITKSIDKSSHIARELLVFAGGNTPTTDMTPVALDTVVQSAWQLCTCRGQNHHLDSELSTIPLLDGNILKLEELFLNLFINSMDAMPDGGTISLTSHIDGHNAIIEICDEGSGIARQDLDRVMEPFFTTKPTGQGTGLGLSICFGIMELHGGTINLRPRADRCGTCVLLTFPIPSVTTDTTAGRWNETASGH